MDDGFKITNDKRHRSSSSLVAGIEGSRSERKLDIRASIPEVEDQFVNAEARCDDLQEKIDLVKTLRRKKKLKKRSMTTIVEPVVTVENVPFIKVRAQPKKKISQQAARLHRMEVPQKAHNRTRSYLDPDLIEQHQMLGRVHGYQVLNPQAQNKTRQSRLNHENMPSPKARRRARADGDGMCGQGVQIDVQNIPQEVACGNESDSYNYLDENIHHHIIGMNTENKERTTARNNDGRQQSKHSSKIRPHHMPWMDETLDTWGVPPSGSIRPKSNRNQENTDEYITFKQGNVNEKESRPVVELFNKSRRPSGSTVNGKKNPKIVVSNEEMPSRVKGLKLLRHKKPEITRSPGHRCVRSQSYRYELPTVSSKMKQAGMRCYDDHANTTNIPFVVSKSTAPSHNVGVNLQQVLNGLKIRQPLSGIPLTIAHHMGLRHDPSYGSKSAPMELVRYEEGNEDVYSPRCHVLTKTNCAPLVTEIFRCFSKDPAKNPTLRNSEINVIKLGGRLLRLSTYKHMSYSRLLSLYREGDGIVPRFLRAMSRPHYFYTSEYNLATNHEDFDAATSKGRVTSLAAYANLYREYENVEKDLLIKKDARLLRRREILARELAAGEDYIRKVVEECKPNEEVPLRATASTAEDGYRHSTFKLHESDHHQ